MNDASLNSRQKPIRLAAAHIVAVKVLIHLSALGCLLRAYYLALSDQAGGDPVEAVLHFTGIGAFNLLLLCLLVSPVAKWSKQSRLMALRRLLGLYVFVYAFAHFASFIAFELQFEWRLVWAEVVDRPYITVGFAALVILLALTITSNKGAQKKLGRSWQVLHHGIYLAALLTALHYLWSVKSAELQPFVYLLVLVVLLLPRRRKLLRFYRKKTSG
jgi:sulfoxide reductase heme-binding subunit YedZ